jgi:hypothetical protein
MLLPQEQLNVSLAQYSRPPHTHLQEHASFRCANGDPDNFVSGSIHGHFTDIPDQNMKGAKGLAPYKTHVFYEFRLVAGGGFEPPTFGL